MRAFSRTKIQKYYHFDNAQKSVQSTCVTSVTLKRCAETYSFSRIIICFIWITIIVSTHTFMDIFFKKNHKILVYPSSFQKKKKSKFLIFWIKFRKVVCQIMAPLYSAKNDVQDFAISQGCACSLTSLRATSKCLTNV